MAWTTVTVEGGLFAPDLLDQVSDGQGQGQRPEDFGLEGGRLSDEIQSAFSDAQSYWDSYHRRLDRSAEDQYTTLTRNAWMIPFFGLLGYREGDLIFQRGSTTVAGVDYNISHFAGNREHAPPLHIVGSQYRLDRRPPQGGRAPHSLVQEFLNRDDALWGIVTNGSKLRVLRDSQRMTRPTYLEFDLEGMITGSQYAEFALLYRILHRTRFPRGADDAHTCLLERWFEQGIEQGGRVRDKLRDGVEAALEGLGRSFLQHPESEALRRQTAGGQYSAPDYNRELLRLIYRLLFLMVAEERGLLFPAESSEQPASDRNSGRQAYENHYSVTQLRTRAARPDAQHRESSRHSDLWQGLLTTFRIFRADELASQLGLQALNGELFGELACRRLEAARISNAALLEAIDRLGRFDDGQTTRRVNYAALDVEELGSVYESLLDFEPVIDSANPDQPEMWNFRLTAGGGRKSSGSYYTPRELVQELIGSALVPVIEQRLKDAGRDQDAQEQALLSMTVIDPAAGSGHFLLAAARRIARELARVRTGEREPAPEAVRTAMRDVVPSCIYGVDKNPMAVDLCKVALWIEGHAPGQPLSFLDHHIKHGDSLIGVYDLQVLQDGIPDGAYKALTGDDKAVASRMKKVNKQNRAGQLPMLPDSLFSHDARALGLEFSDLGSLPDSTPQDVEEKAEIYESLRSQDTKWWDLKVACDLWTYAFFAPLTDESWIPTSYDVRQAAQKSGANPKLEGDAIAASEEHPYFHWPLQFPDVLDDGGFDVVLGNPPWERVRLEERQWFAGRDDRIADTGKKDERTKLIDALSDSNPSLFAEFIVAKHLAEATSNFSRASARYPFAATGDVNTYPLFTELNRVAKKGAGMVGMIVPTGIATGDPMRAFFADLVTSGQLRSLHDFENQRALFPAVHRAFKFSLLVLGPIESERPIDFAFFMHQTADLTDSSRRFDLTAEDFVKMNPNSKNAPIFRTRRDADITREIYKHVPVLKLEAGENPWSVEFTTMYHLTSDSSLLILAPELEQAAKENRFLTLTDVPSETHLRRSEQFGVIVPVYEAKEMHQFDHRWARFTLRSSVKSDETRALDDAAKEVPTEVVNARYWVSKDDVEDRLVGRWDRRWLMGWRDVTDNKTVARTTMMSVLPRVGVSYSIRLMFVEKTSLSSALIANLNSFPLDYIARQKVGDTHLTFVHMRQFPILPPEKYVRPTPWQSGKPLLTWITERVVELTYTAWDLQPFAQDHAYNGPPFRWDPERRFEIRCELDAAYFHLYGIERDDVDYIMSTFPIVQRRDEVAHGTYRTRDRILELYDAMASGEWQTSLNPPPADPRAAHPG